MYESIHSSRLNNFAFGAIKFDGALAKDSYVEISPNSPLAAADMDASGARTTISKLGDRSATITFQLQSQSDANAALADLVRQDDLNDTVTISNITVQTSGTLYLYDMIGCFILERPSLSKSDDLSGISNTWVFHCSKLKEKDLSTLTINADIKATLSGGVSATIENTISI